MNKADEKEEFVIERITANRTHKVKIEVQICIKLFSQGKNQYLVKWKDYDESENSWIDSDLVSADRLVNEYLLKKSVQ